LPKRAWAGGSLSRLPAGLAGDAAFRLFCMPELSYYRAANHLQLAERARFHLRNARWRRVATPVADIQTYIFEPDRRVALGTVLVVHGWTGEASFMTALAEPIRRAGYRVVLFDLPAHGLSGERSTNLIECARATVMVGRQFGPLSAIVAHSFGGMISLVAAEGHPPMPHALATPRVVPDGAPSRRVSSASRAARLPASPSSSFCGRRGARRLSFMTARTTKSRSDVRKKSLQRRTAPNYSLMRVSVIAIFSLRLLSRERSSRIYCGRRIARFKDPIAAARPDNIDGGDVPNIPVLSSR